MNITEEMTELEELTFQIYYGALFAISLNLEYFDGLISVLTDKADTYTVNKIKEAVRGCNLTYKLISSRIYKDMNEEQIAIAKQALNIHHDLAYSVFGLDSDQQDKVKEFISKL